MADKQRVAYKGHVHTNVCPKTYHFYLEDNRDVGASTHKLTYQNMVGNMALPKWASIMGRAPSALSGARAERSQAQCSDPFIVQIPKHEHEHEHEEN